MGSQRYIDCVRGVRAAANAAAARLLDLEPDTEGSGPQATCLQPHIHLGAEQWHLVWHAPAFLLFVSGASEEKVSGCILNSFTYIMFNRYLIYSYI